MYILLYLCMSVVKLLCIDVTDDEGFTTSPGWESLSVRHTFIRKVGHIKNYYFYTHFLHILHTCRLTNSYYE